MLTRRTVLAIAAPSLLACSGLATPPTPDGPPASRSDEPVADEPPVMIPDGPWVLELEDADGRCSWRMRGLEGTPVSLGQHDGGCPSGWSLGVDERGVPSVGITESGQVILRDHQDLQPIPPPPAGEPVRAAWLDGDVVVDTRVTGDFDKPLTYGDRTYSQTEFEGLPAFAVRWRRSADGRWAEEQVVETTTGWDYAADVDALKPPLPDLPYAGKGFREDARDVEDLGAVQGVPTVDGQEGWLIADGPHGRIVTGFFYGEGIRASKPVAVEHDGSFTVLELPEGLSQLNLHHDAHHLSVASPFGGGQLVDLATGEVLLTTEHRMFWLGAR